MAIFKPNIPYATMAIPMINTTKPTVLHMLILPNVTNTTAHTFDASYDPHGYDDEYL
jgi:hypothetical protein